MLLQKESQIESEKTQNSTNTKGPKKIGVPKVKISSDVGVS